MGKTFTLHEAQTLVPVIDALFVRAREARATLIRCEAELQLLGQRIFLSGGLLVDVRAVARRRAERDKSEQLVKSAIEEIDEIGARILDSEEGILALPSVVDGRTILLCWTVGDTRIAFWREEDDEPDVRNPIDGRFGPGTHHRPN